MSDIFQFDNGDLKITCFKGLFYFCFALPSGILVILKHMIKEIFPMNILAAEPDKEVM